jgi:hypothetical protein
LRETLGWGGNGIAGLYYHTRQDRTREYFVAKYSIRPDPSYTEALMQEKDQLEVRVTNQDGSLGPCSC